MFGRDGMAHQAVECKHRTAHIQPHSRYWFKWVWPSGDSSWVPWECNLYVIWNPSKGFALKQTWDTIDFLLLVYPGVMIVTEMSLSTLHNNKTINTWFNWNLMFRRQETRRLNLYSLLSHLPSLQMQLETRCSSPNVAYVLESRTLMKKISTLEALFPKIEQFKTEGIWRTTRTGSMNIDSYVVTNQSLLTWSGNRTIPFCKARFTTVNTLSPDDPIQSTISDFHRLPRQIKTTPLNVLKACPIDTMSTPPVHLCPWSFFQLTFVCGMAWWSKDGSWEPIQLMVNNTR